MNKTREKETLPPPPPPLGREDDSLLPEEQLDQRSAFRLLQRMGYPVEQLSPWRLVTLLLADLIQEKESKESMEAGLRKADEEKQMLLLEMARRINEEQEEEKDDEKKADIRGDARARAYREVTGRNARRENELARCRAALADCQRECQRLASVANFASQGKETVVDELASEHRTLNEAQQRASELASALEENKNQIRILEDEIDRLRVEVVKKEGTEETLKHRLDRATQSIKASEEAKHAVEEALSKSREETKVQSELVLEERRSKKMMKARMDEIVKELDNSRTELSKVERDRASLEKAKLELEQQNGILKRQVNAQAEVLSTRDDELRACQTKLAALERTLEDERKAHNLRLHEVRAAAQDVANMTRENRELTRALERAGGEIRDLKATLEETRSKQSRFAGMLDAAKLERAELIAAVRKLNEDKSRMSEDMRAMADARTDLVKEERQASDEVIELTRKIVDLESRLRRQQGDLEDAEKRAEGLARELRSTKSRMEALEENKTLSDKASGSEQQKYLQATRQHDLLRMELEQTRTELGICAGRLDKAQQETTRLTEQLVQERLKVEELESQLERARIAQAKALISSGQAFVSQGERLRTGTPSARKRESEEIMSSSSSMREFDDNYQELERVMGGDDLSEASSVIRRAREERERQTPSFMRRSSPSLPPPV